MIVEVLKLDIPVQHYVDLRLRNWLPNLGKLRYSGAVHSKIIKITTFMSWILIWNVHIVFREYCTPDQFFDCLCIFLKNYNTLITSKMFLIGNIPGNLITALEFH